MLSQRAAAKVAAFLFSALLAGCACGLRVGDAGRLSRTLAAAGFKHHRIVTNDFVLHAWLRALGSETLTVVIEGDGASWFNPRWPPADPTPEHSQSAAVAAALTGAVAYLARPCQFEQTAACRLDYWTMGRFAPDLVTALDIAIDKLKQQAGAKRLWLVGHSGGGVMAALLAQRRPDVVRLVTFMAPLALSEWTRQLDITPLTGLDPAKGLTLTIPAIHVAGGRDEIVPAGIVRRYANGKGEVYLEWPEATHACWPIEAAVQLVEDAR